jgi:outer membrane protein OmpA-like peptidoglycan-associated protein
VNFPSGKADLSVSAKERLSRFSGLVAAHPDLKFQVEGHTDNVGEPTFNQKLSQTRAEAVRDYLVQQGVPAASITAEGLGDADPVASNNTSEGRAQNRRVEIIVSGDVIGTHLGK